MPDRFSHLNTVLDAFQQQVEQLKAAVFQRDIQIKSLEESLALSQQELQSKQAEIDTLKQQLAAAQSISTHVELSNETYALLSQKVDQINEAIASILSPASEPVPPEPAESKVEPQAEEPPAEPQAEPTVAEKPALKRPARP